jgi:hypothetical protein
MLKKLLTPVLVFAFALGLSVVFAGNASALTFNQCLANAKSEYTKTYAAAQLAWKEAKDSLQSKKREALTATKSIKDKAEREAKIKEINDNYTKDFAAASSTRIAAYLEAKNKLSADNKICTDSRYSCLKAASDVRENKLIDAFNTYFPNILQLHLKKSADIKEAWTEKDNKKRNAAIVIVMNEYKAKKAVEWNKLDALRKTIQAEYVAAARLCTSDAGTEAKTDAGI